MNGDDCNYNICKLHIPKAGLQTGKPLIGFINKIEEKQTSGLLRYRQNIEIQSAVGYKEMLHFKFSILYILNTTGSYRFSRMLVFFTSTDATYIKHW